LFGCTGSPAFSHTAFYVNNFTLSVGKHYEFKYLDDYIGP